MKQVPPPPIFNWSLPCEPFKRRGIPQDLTPVFSPPLSWLSKEKRRRFMKRFALAEK